MEARRARRGGERKQGHSLRCFCVCFYFFSNNTPMIHAVSPPSIMICFLLKVCSLFAPFSSFSITTKSIHPQRLGPRYCPPLIVLFPPRPPQPSSLYCRLITLKHCLPIDVFSLSVLLPIMPTRHAQPVHISPCSFFSLLPPPPRLSWA